MLSHDEIILGLCEAISWPSAFHAVLNAEDIVESEDIKQKIHDIAVRLYHREEGRDMI